MNDHAAAGMGQAVGDSFPREPRHARLRRLLDEHSLDCLVAVGRPYTTWLTGYARYFAGTSAIIATPDGTLELVTSTDEAAIAERESSATRVTTYGEGGFGLDPDPLSTLLGALAGNRTVMTASTVAVAGLDQASLSRFGWPKTVDIGAAVQEELAVKDRDEAEKVAASYNLCLAAQAAVAEGVANGATELELFTQAHSTAQLAFGAPVEFISDLLSGPNTAEVCCPIVVAGPRRAAPGEPVVADIAVGAGGYWGDTCRTYVSGQNDELAAQLGQLARLLDATVAGIRPGQSGREVHASMAAAIVETFPDSEPLPHHGGHGIGLGPCDSPHVIPADKTLLRPGMILAMEPGAYFKGRYGIRHENEYLITSAGGIELNSALAAAGQAS